VKNASPRLIEALKNGTALKALPEVVIDWNLNRYIDTRVDNVPNEQETGYDIELFPIETLVEPVRPRKGINKARVGHSTIGRDYTDVGGGMDARFYIADVDDIYKYWTSPKPAVGGVIPLFNTTNFPLDEYIGLTGHDNLTSARPFVEYGDWSADNKVFTPKNVKANKIVIKLENTWASPNDFDIVITRANSTQTIPNENLSGWEASGEIVLYWNGFNWTQNGFRINDANGFPATDPIRRIQLVVRTLKGGYQSNGSVTQYWDTDTNSWKPTTGADSFLDVIEIGAHLEADLSQWVVDVDDSFDLADASNLYPIGTVTSNQGHISLSNIYEIDGEAHLGLFSHENTSIIWSDYLEPNAQVTLRYAFYDEDEDEPFERVTQFVMYTESWTGQSDDNVTMDVTDHSKFFNDQLVLPAMWEGLKAPEIMWRLLDSVGFNNYHIDRGDLVTEHVIPVFYTTGEENVWEVLGELAKATQTAVYFDNEGVLQIRTREYALSPLEAPVWDFQAYDSPEQRANIVTLDQTTEFEPNSIRVIYQKTNWSDFNNGNPTMQKVWEPEDSSVVLRATPLVRNLSETDEYLWIGADDVKVWPYAGLVNVEGEIIRYNGKVLAWYAGPAGNQLRNTIVRSEDEKNDVMRQIAPGHGYKAHFLGALRIAQDENGDFERGVWNSEPRDHNVEATGYSVRKIVNGNHRTDAAGFRHLKQESKIQLNAGPHMDSYSDILLATRGATDDSPFFYYGTRMKFIPEQGNTHQRAGIVIHNSTANENGYYIELTPSSKLGGKERKKRQELMLYSRVGGKDHVIDKRALAIGENIEYEIDITYINLPNSPDHRIQVWVNGKNAISAIASPSNGTKNAENGKFGLFVRGKTKAQFEYLYAVRREEEGDLDEDFSFLDKVDRGYMGGQWDREWTYRWKDYKRRVKKKSVRARKRFNRQFFDEFGPIVHEIREFDVKFDPKPVLHSRLYLTNDWGAIPLEYRGNPFGAKFVIANTARYNSVIHGDDTLSFAGTGQSVNQVVTCLGRALEIAEAEEVVAENTDQIRRRGKSETDLTSPWIQSKAMAENIAAWMRNNFTYGNDGISLEVFGNPLIEIGDVVTVDYPEKYISGDYFVMGVKNEYQNGIVTSLDLRRRV